jgi:hypothetical protein
MERKPQTFANHGKYDPVFHFVLSPLALVLFIGATAAAVNEGTGYAWWRAGVGFVLFLGLFKMRLYSLKVQDRVIRLEERLRLAQVLPDRSRSRIGELTEGQLIALRFASDAELPALVDKALAEKTAPTDIKKLIANWRPDYYRV